MFENMAKEMREMLVIASKGTKFEGNENELYIAIVGDFAGRTDLTREEMVKKIAKRIFDTAMVNGMAV